MGTVKSTDGGLGCMHCQRFDCHVHLRLLGEGYSHDDAALFPRHRYASGSCRGNCTTDLTALCGHGQTNTARLYTHVLLGGRARWRDCFLDQAASRCTAAVSSHICTFGQAVELLPAQHELADQSLLGRTGILARLKRRFQRFGAAQVLM